MDFKKIRTIVAAIVFVVLAVGIILNVAAGTLCGFGWEDIAVLCPVGALESMLAAKTLVPREIISIVIMIVLVFLLGRAFCGWICPVTLLEKIRGFFTPTNKKQEEAAAKAEANRRIGEYEISLAKGDNKKSCESCGACKHHHGKLDSRHAVLGGTLLSAAIFGFPVFCLICPVGLTFATVVVVTRLFGVGDVTWSALLIPALLLVEVLFLRKWCTRFCPLSAFMNLIGRFSKTARPEIDNSLCLETSKGVACGHCATVCQYDVNLRHPEYGELSVVDCSRCMDCVSSCPAHAIKIPVVNKKD